MRRIGIDTGGTFTDCVLIDDDANKTTVSKVPSQPGRPDLAIINGIGKLLQLAGLELGEIDTISHGTTVATNAVITGNVARTGMITSRGCRDVIEIGSQQRPRLYDFHQTRAPAPVPRDLRLDVPGRIAFDGTETEPTDRAEIEKAVLTLIDRGVESLAVAGLFSFLNPAHEQTVREIIARLAPDLYVACSSVICPEIREYPRFATTATNAALAPVLDPYIKKLENSLKANGLAAPLYIMQSSGGVGTVKQSVGEGAHNLVLSGPAAGIIGGAAIARASGFPEVVTLDVGGTSADVGLVTRGEPHTRMDMLLPNGVPLKLRNLEIEAIGTGGGSIASIDAGGALCVGPQSAGADPGPVCYGIGGTDPTLTDAQLVLGRLNPAGLLSGALKINREASRQALAELGARLGLSAEQAALGVVKVADANMAGAIRLMAARNGDDLRDFALVAAGGAGPLNSVSLAASLGMAAVLVPPNPGLLSAAGLLAANLRRDYSLPLLVYGDELTVAQSTAAFDELLARAHKALEEDGVNPDHRRFDYVLDVRYVGQDYTVAVPVERDSRAAQVIGQFHPLHERAYGHSAPGERVEVVSARLVAWGMFDQLRVDRPLPKSHGKPVGHRDVWFEESSGFVLTPIYDRETLGLGQAVSGPAIVEQLDTTTMILPGFVGKVDKFGVLVIRSKEKLHG